MRIQDNAFVQGVFAPTFASQSLEAFCQEAFLYGLGKQIEKRLDSWPELADHLHASGTADEVEAYAQAVLQQYADERAGLPLKDWIHKEALFVAQELIANRWLRIELLLEAGADFWPQRLPVPSGVRFETIMVSKLEHDDRMGSHRRRTVAGMRGALRLGNRGESLASSPADLLRSLFESAHEIDDKGRRECEWLHDQANKIMRMDL